MKPGGGWGCSRSSASKMYISLCVQSVMRAVFESVMIGATMKEPFENRKKY